MRYAHKMATSLRCTEESEHLKNAIISVVIVRHTPSQRPKMPQIAISQFEAAEGGVRAAVHGDTAAWS